MRALARLNDEHGGKLLNTCRTISLRMPRFEDSEDVYVRDNAKFFCEDSRLSVPHVGSRVRGLLIDDAKTPVLSLDMLQEVIDFCAAFVDTDKLMADTYAKFSSKSASRKHAWELHNRGQNMLKRVKPRNANDISGRLGRIALHASPAREELSAN